MVRLTRLTIQRFRNVVPGTDLRFGPTFNSLLGKNATGKTTLLDLVAALTNDDLSAYAQEDAGFDLTWWLESAGVELELHATRTPAKLAPGFNQGREENEFDDAWKMVVRTEGIDALQVKVDGRSGTWKASTGPEQNFDVKAGLADGRAFSRTLRIIPNAVIPQATALWRTRTFSLQGVGRFDEALGALENITRATVELQINGLRVLNGSYGAWIPDGWLLSLLSKKLPEPLRISFDQLATLAKIPSALGFAKIEMYPRLFERSQTGESVTTTYHGIDFLFERSDGSQVSHGLLSFGQKRLFAFLWYLAVRRGFPVVADELLNGLHHEWIEICVDRLRERQSFLATQHPLLLDHIPIESAEAVRTTFLRCSVERGADGREQLAWRNFNEEEAERFYIAYQTGIQQVSEVLRSEGLW